MGLEPTVLTLLILLVSGHVMSFSVGRRSARSTDLAQALSILQRQRRRIGGDEFFDPERLLEARPVGLSDVGDWLGRARDPSDDEGMDDVWMSDRGNFRDFEDRPQLNYDLTPLILDRELSEQDQEAESAPYEVQASRKELDNIFDTDDDSETMSGPQTADLSPEKKKKEEMVDVRGDKKVVQKKSIFKPTVDHSASSDDGISLDSLTKEEFRALMKAVEKLQKQAARLSEDVASESSSSPGTVVVKETVVKDTPEGEEVEEKTKLVPAGEDELDSVFAENDTPIVGEAKIVQVEQEGGPEGSETRTLETDLIPLLSGSGEDEDSAALEEAIVTDLQNGIEEEEREAEAVEAVRRRLEEEEAEKEAVDDDEEEEEAEAESERARGMESLDDKQLAALENYWLVSSYLDKTPPSPPPQPMKRTAKRAALLSDPFLSNGGDILSDDVDDISDDVTEEEGTEPDVLEELKAGSVPSVKAFVVRILELQDELDRLRTVTRLEDLENDELTDALNEATLAQSEGSVSDLEFEALQQAIRIEEALQEIKKEANKMPVETDLIKRGEPWRRKRGPDVELVDDTPSLTSAVPVYPVSTIKHQGPSKSDIERLLGESYLLQEAEDEAAAEDEADQEEELEEAPVEAEASGKVASLFLRHADQCPAVRKYSTNCELADLYSLPVDYEARALCNLHEMCYACGQSLTISQEHCDLVYRAAAAALCNDQDACVLESEIFLRTMKLKTRYVPHAQTSCRSTCAARFLGML